MTSPIPQDFSTRAGNLDRIWPLLICSRLGYFLQVFALLLYMMISTSPSNVMGNSILTLDRQM